MSRLDRSNASAPSENDTAESMETSEGRPKVVSGAATTEFEATPTYLELHTPAKTNFTLHVGQREAALENRHRVKTLYCSVGLYDDVSLTLKRAHSGFSLDLEGANLGDLAGDDADMRHNLAVQALFALAKHAHKKPNVGIRIFKRIPVNAGLGGASADAAAVLVGLNKLWNLHYDVDELRGIGAQLGSKVPFCITGGLLQGAGYGDEVEPLSAALAKQLGPELNFTTMLLGTYHHGLSTTEVYAELDRQRALANATAATADTGEFGSDFPSTSFGHNDLSEAAIALFPRAGAAIRDAVEAAEGVTAFISGSGPTVVACLPDPSVMWKVIGAWKASRTVDRIVRVEAPAELTTSSAD